MIDPFQMRYFGLGDFTDPAKFAIGRLLGASSEARANARDEKN
jgi:hypothetical protein